MIQVDIPGHRIIVEEEEEEVIGIMEGVVGSTEETIIQIIITLRTTTKIETLTKGIMKIVLIFVEGNGRPNNDAHMRNQYACYQDGIGSHMYNSNQSNSPRLHEYNGC